MLTIMWKIATHKCLLAFYPPETIPEIHLGLLIKLSLKKVPMMEIGIFITLPPRWENWNLE